MATISAIKAAAHELAAVELKEQRNKVIEECARVADEYERKSNTMAAMAAWIARDIRALKDKP